MKGGFLGKEKVNMLHIWTVKKEMRRGCEETAKISFSPKNKNKYYAYAPNEGKKIIFAKLEIKRRIPA